MDRLNSRINNLTEVSHSLTNNKRDLEDHAEDEGTSICLSNELPNYVLILANVMFALISYSLGHLIYLILNVGVGYLFTELYEKAFTDFTTEHIDRIKIGKMDAISIFHYNKLYF